MIDGLPPTLNDKAVYESQHLIPERSFFADEWDLSVISMTIFYHLWAETDKIKFHTLPKVDFSHIVQLYP